MRERVVLILDGIKGGSLPGFPRHSSPRSVHLDGWHSYGKFARDSRLTPVVDTFATLPSGRYILLRLGSRFREIYIYICILYMGSVEVKVGKVSNVLRVENFCRFFFFSFSFFLRKEEIVIWNFIWMNYLYTKWLTWYIQGEMNFSWNEDINVLGWIFVDKFH